MRECKAYWCHVNLLILLATYVLLHSLIITLNAGNCSKYAEEDEADEPLAKKIKLDGMSFMLYNCAGAFSFLI